MTAEDQVCVVYAGVRGFLDKMVTSEIPKFEAMFLAFLKSNHPKLLQTISSTGDLSEEHDNELKVIIEAFLPESGLQMRA